MKILYLFRNRSHAQRERIAPWVEREQRWRIAPTVQTWISPRPT